MSAPNCLPIMRHHVTPPPLPSALLLSNVLHSKAQCKVHPLCRAMHSKAQHSATYDVTPSALCSVQGLVEQCIQQDDVVC